MTDTDTDLDTADGQPTKDARVTCPYRLDPAGTDRTGESRVLHEHGPVMRVELPGGVQAWSVSSQAILKQLLRDERVSKDPTDWRAWRDGDITPEWTLYTWVGVTNMFTARGSEHRRLRTPVTRAFTARRVAALRGSIEHVTTELLDQLATRAPDEPVDLRAQLAYPLPIAVICSLFGVPEGLRDRLQATVGQLFDTTAPPDETTAASRELYTVLARLVQHRRADPGDDLTSALIADTDNGHGTLSEAELVDTLLLMLGAGHETTVNLINTTITALLPHPDALAQARSGAVSWSTIIEETLRWQAPIAHLPLRYARADIALDEGVTIHAGDAILASYAAAGRDPAVHTDPDEFRPKRTSTAHLAFGHGSHFCLGAALARLEAEIVVPDLFARFPDISLATAPDALQPLPSLIANGHQELPVLLGTAKNTANTRNQPDSARA